MNDHPKGSHPPGLNDIEAVPNQLHSHTVWPGAGADQDLALS